MVAVEQVIVNLLTNAAKYTHRGGKIVVTASALTRPNLAKGGYEEQPLYGRPDMETAATGKQYGGRTLPKRRAPAYCGDVRSAASPLHNVSARARHPFLAGIVPDTASAPV